MAKFVYETDRINYVATADIKAGDIVEAGALHGVADTYAVGDAVNFASGKAAKTGGKPLGIAVEPKTATQDTVTVMLKN